MEFNLNELHNFFQGFFSNLSLEFQSYNESILFPNMEKSCSPWLIFSIIFLLQLWIPAFFQKESSILEIDFENGYQVLYHHSPLSILMEGPYYYKKLLRIFEF